eukprot:6191715-Pleurochrysis_carterae.AAC.2
MLTGNMLRREEDKNFKREEAGEQKLKHQREKRHGVVHSPFKLCGAHTKDSTRSREKIATTMHLISWQARGEEVLSTVAGGRKTCKEESHHNGACGRAPDKMHSLERQPDGISSGNVTPSVP